MLESTVKLAVVAPLLDLAGLFLPPFYVTTEDSVEITANDGNMIVRGRIDVLVLQEQLWVLAIGQDNDLDRVLQILKQLAAIAGSLDS